MEVIEFRREVNKATAFPIGAWELERTPTRDQTLFPRVRELLLVGVAQET